MLRRWIHELATALHRPDVSLAANAYTETVDATFTQLIWQISEQRRVVLLVDGLDQFESTNRARFLTWLPRSWPTNVRLITTAIPGDASKALTEGRGGESLPLPPLDRAEARAIIQGICQRYHRTFEAEVIEALLAKMGRALPAWENPLWLVLAVEELNLLDADDFGRVVREYMGAPSERLRDFMIDQVMDLPSDIPGLYDHTFKRAEELFGTGFTCGFLGLIAVGRAGWRESDFRILLPRASGEEWDELQFAQLRRFFRGQMRRRGALNRLDFNHAQMRTAVRARLISTSMAERKLHKLVADHLWSCQPDDPLRITEIMVHLLGSEDYSCAGRYNGDALLLDEVEEKSATAVLAEAVISPQTGTSVTAAQAISCLLERTDMSLCPFLIDRFIFNVSAAIEHNAPLNAHLVILESSQRALEGQLQPNLEDDRLKRLLAVVHGRIGNVLKAQGDRFSALQRYRKTSPLLEICSSEHQTMRTCNMIFQSPITRSERYNLRKANSRTPSNFRRRPWISTRSWCNSNPQMFHGKTASQ
jgi:hypothetical protein